MTTSLSIDGLAAFESIHTESIGCTEKLVRFHLRAPAAAAGRLDFWYRLTAMHRFDIAWYHDQAMNRISMRSVSSTSRLVSQGF
jgi:hypothetical protein